MELAGKTRIKLYFVDTFTEKAFSGSPAPVCVLPYGLVLDDQTMKNIAMELSMSEAAFLRPLAPADSFASSSRFELRWFKPAYEVRLCGHGTVATAAVLFNIFANKSEAITLHTTYSGDLVVCREGARIAVDFPLGVTVLKTQAEYESTIRCFHGTLGVRDVRLCPALRYLLIRLQDGLSRSQFEEMSYDLRGLEKAVKETGLILVIVTTQASRAQGYVDLHGQQYDFASRVFVPFSVREEDPVTGSAHTVLAHYWSQELGKNDLYARQCSPRGGEVHMTVEGDRVHILADVTVVMEGELTV